MSTSNLAHGAKPTKTVHIYKDGDKFFSGKKILINPRSTRNFESFLSQVTSTLKPGFGAVRVIRTPEGGTRVSDLDNLQTGQAYVGCGAGRFHKLGYKDIVAASPSKQHGLSPREYGNRRSRLVVSGRIKRVKREPIAIFVYRNGDALEPAKRILLQPWVQRTWDIIMSAVNDKINLPNGTAVRKLWDMSTHEAITDANQLMNNQFYVAVGSDKYKDIEYGAHLLLSPRAQQQQQQRRKPLHLAPIKRRSKPSNNSSGTNSTGSTVNTDTSRTTKGSHEDRSQRPPRKPAPKKEGGIPVKPIKHKRSSEGQGRKQVDLDEDRGGIYKAKDKHVADNAEEVREDKHTKTEVPVDEREAEEVEEEPVRKPGQSKNKTKPPGPVGRPVNPPPNRKPAQVTSPQNKKPAPIAPPPGKANMKRKPSEKPIDQDEPLPPIAPKQESNQSQAAHQTTVLAMAQVEAGHHTDDEDEVESIHQSRADSPEVAAGRRATPSPAREEAARTPTPIEHTPSPELERKETPKQDTPKPESPKPETPNRDSPNQRGQTPERDQTPEDREPTPKPDSPITAPPQESPRPESKSPNPSVSSKPSSPQPSESPKPESPKPESLKAESPKPDSPKPTSPAGSKSSKPASPVQSTHTATPPPASPKASPKGTPSQSPVPDEVKTHSPTPSEPPKSPASERVASRPASQRSQASDKLNGSRTNSAAGATERKDKTPEPQPGANTAAA